MCEMQPGATTTGRLPASDDSKASVTRFRCTGFATPCSARAGPSPPRSGAATATDRPRCTTIAGLVWGSKGNGFAVGSIRGNGAGLGAFVAVGLALLAPAASANTSVSVVNGAVNVRGDSADNTFEIR